MHLQLLNLSIIIINKVPLRYPINSSCASKKNMLKIFYEWGGLNKQLFIAINKLTNINLLPDLLLAISSLFFIANFAVIYIIICLVLYFKIPSHSNKKEYFSRAYYELVRVGIYYALFGISFAIMKFSVNLPRPFCSLNPANFLTILDTTNERCLSSFPSAHTGLSILVAYILWPYLDKIYRAFSCLIIIAVATSRITLAMHYPADILYSVCFTTLIILTSNLIFFLIKPTILKKLEPHIFRLLFAP